MPKLINDWSQFGYTEEEWRKLSKSRRYYIRHPEKAKANRLKFANANKQYMSDRQRKYQLMDKYGITEDDYNSMLKDQNGKCAICETTTPTGKWKRFAVDHCHITGIVRGLLCNECNRGMGLLKDNPELLLKAANYLQERKSNGRK